MTVKIISLLSRNFEKKPIVDIPELNSVKDVGLSQNSSVFICVEYDIERKEL